MLYNLAGILVIGLINSIELLIVLLMVQYLCAAHVHFTNKTLAITLAINFVGQSILSLLPNNSFYEFFQFVVLFFAVIICSKRKITDFFATIVAYFLYVVFSVLPYFLVIRSLRVDSIQFTLFGEQLSVVDFVIDLVLLVALFSARTVLDKYEFIVPFSFNEILVGIFLGSISFILLVALDYARLLSSPFDIVWIIVTDISYIALNAFYFYTIIRRRKDLYHEKQARLNKAFVDMQLDSLAQYKEREDDIRKMRHDIKKHLSIIEALLLEDKKDDALSYISDLNESYRPKTQFITGNQIVDVIVNSKYYEAMQRDIDFTFDGTLYEFENMAGPDICGLLVNAYDNALEALDKMKLSDTSNKPYIHTTISNKNNYLTIVIKNSVSKMPNIKHNHVETTKINKASHGYGLAIMQQITKKYFGKLAISSTDSEFTLKIMLLKSGLQPVPSQKAL